MNFHSGVVIKGKGRAGALGYPTVNIPLKNSDVSGIYSARVKVGDEKYIAAVFADPERKLLEAHLLDFVGALYGKEITIELCKKTRDSKEFTDNEALRTAIAEDVAKVREYFKEV